MELVLEPQTEAQAAATLRILQTLRSFDTPAELAQHIRRSKHRLALWAIQEHQDGLQDEILGDLYWLDALANDLDPYTV
jgi:hypothetical protein